LRLDVIDWRVLLGAAAVVVAVLMAFSWWRRRPRDPEEIERRRRAHLNQIGRIVEGQIIEIVEAPVQSLQPASCIGPFRKRKASRDAPNGTRKLVFYSYSISGVTYETAQDITGLEERACLDRLVAGQPASVKYDPANPSNSILLADDWSGLG
jgi:hypothetical protein